MYAVCLGAAFSFFERGLVYILNFNCFVSEKIPFGLKKSVSKKVRLVSKASQVKS
jgi:hypothetical protein